MDDGDRDLLRPTLDARFDVAAVVEPPWDPGSLVWAALLGGPIGGGLLYGRNYARLGDPRMARLTWIVTAALALAYAGVIGWYVQAGDGEPGAGSAVVIRRIGMLVFVGSALLVRRHQYRIFHGYESAGRPVAKALGAVLLAILINLLGMTALVMLAAGLLSR